MKRVLFFSALGAAFVFGSYLWWDQENEVQEAQTLSHNAFASDVLVYVGQSPIYQKDLEWAYNSHLLGLKDADDLTFIPDVGDHLDQYLAPLKERMIGELIERKLLFEYIKSTGDVDFQRPELFTRCIDEWSKARANATESKHWLSTAEDQERLKRRICEWDIIQAYMENKIFKNIAITDEEIAAYFDKHEHEFHREVQVVIDQIVLASEKEAIQLMSQVNQNNFSNMAQKYSIAPEAANGGRLGPFEENAMAGIFSVAFIMNVGEIRGVLKSTYGFHIIRLAKKLPKMRPSVSEVTPQIRKRLEKEKQEEEYQKWLDLALNSIPVVSPKPLW